MNTAKTTAAATPNDQELEFISLLARAVKELPPAELAQLLADMKAVAAGVRPTAA